MRVIFLLILFFSCTSANSNEMKDMNSWVGKSVEYLVASMGPPQRSSTLSNGVRVLKYNSEQTSNALNQDVVTPNSEHLQNELTSNNATIAELNSLIVNQSNAIRSVEEDFSVVAVLNQHMNLPSMKRGLTQLVNQRSELFEANKQIYEQLNLEKQMAKDSYKQQPHSCYKVFTVNLKGIIISADCL